MLGVTHRILGVLHRVIGVLHRVLGVPHRILPKLDPRGVLNGKQKKILLLVFVGGPSVRHGP